MVDDRIFRIILIVGILVIMPIGVYHRLRSQASGESLDRRQEGAFILLTLRPVGLASMIGLIAYLVNPASMAWSSVPLPAWARWAGVAVGVAGGALMVWTFRTLGPNLTDTVVTRRDAYLVTDGPYRWVRHPFYCAAGLAILANSMVAANWFLLLTGTLVLALIAVRTRTEEEHLLARFGDEYRDYRARTGKFLPRLHGSRKRSR